MSDEEWRRAEKWGDADAARLLGRHRRRIAIGIAVLVAFAAVAGYRCTHPVQPPLRRTRPLPGCRDDKECVLWPWLGVVRGTCTHGVCHVTAVPQDDVIATIAGTRRQSCFE